jgi:hypothetical protein
MDAYEIRLELLKMSKDLLMEEWHRKNMALENVYFQTREIAMQSSNQTVVETQMRAAITEMTLDNVFTAGLKSELTTEIL